MGILILMLIICFGFLNKDFLGNNHYSSTEMTNQINLLILNSFGWGTCVRDFIVWDFIEDFSKVLLLPL